MKERYLELMERSLAAYRNEHILRYLGEVKEKGLSEHGFPRLTANIGILIAHGRRRDLLELFMEMMDVCCAMFLRPNVPAANEFSVREIVLCLSEVEAAGIVEADTVARWRDSLRRIRPTECYDVIVQSETDRIVNWAIFGAVSEYARYAAGLGGDLAFVDRQLSCQFQWLDENGMYRDARATRSYQPIVYDLVPRGLFAILLHLGYRGKYAQRLDECLRRAGLLTLKMQSANGEIPFGGRSNQFLHNEPWLAAVLEYEARRYAREGNDALARTFRSAVVRALDVTEEWLSKEPIRHIKNRYPTETGHGCERYAYFDKYMITVASNLYCAYLLCDDSIPAQRVSDSAPCVFQTSEFFHKVFLKSGGYALELDINADPCYDASGLGRVHRAGAPSVICLSCPCPSQPKYRLTTSEPIALSLCPGIREGNGWLFATDPAVRWEVRVLREEAESAFCETCCIFPSGRKVYTQYTVDAQGVRITVEGSGELGYLLPALCFDGEQESELRCENDVLSVLWAGWCCRYTVEGGVIEDGEAFAENRNGRYRIYRAVGTDRLSVRIEIDPA